MPMALCASCKSKVEDGGVRCTSCGASLDRPGAFLTVVGWVVLALSAIPLAISGVTTVDRNLAPLIAGIIILIAGIIMVCTGRARTRGADPRTVANTQGLGPSAEG